MDVGWYRLSDLNILEGKLLGSSYNQCCVGVWVVDLLRIEPYAIGNVTRLNGHSESRFSSSGKLSELIENTTKASLGQVIHFTKHRAEYEGNKISRKVVCLSKFGSC